MVSALARVVWPSWGFSSLSESCPCPSRVVSPLARVVSALTRVVSGLAGVVSAAARVVSPLAQVASALSRVVFFKLGLPLQQPGSSLP